MNVICIPLRGNMDCGTKMSTDVAATQLPQKKSSQDLKLHIYPPKFRHHYNRNRFVELETGDPSRNVVEMIFRASSVNPKKCRTKIKRVIKVDNPLEILGKFEKYRERVMFTPYNEQRRHPRSSVDGNEVLQFYGATMNCSAINERVTELCRDPRCRVCSVIRTGFNTPYNKVNGIRLSKRSDKMSEEVLVSKNARKAVIICRTITGMDDGRLQQKSFRDEACDESMLVRNPSAILPCFVIVF